jgi:hypothetical protein
VTDRLYPSCRRCRYWENADPDHDETGDCVRNPPVARLDGELPTAVFPVTQFDQRCGEFRTSWIGVPDPNETPVGVFAELELGRIADYLLRLAKAIEAEHK